MSQRRQGRLASLGITVEKTPRPTYRRAVEWIAYNDEDAIMDLEYIQDMVSVALVADLFRIPAEKVAKRVLQIRRADHDV